MLLTPEQIRRILWVKAVTRNDDLLAYSGEDETARHREPREPGDEFELHTTEEDAESLSLPAAGDVIALIQHDQLTHLVEVVGEKVTPRLRRTMRRNSNDSHYPMQRTCRLLVLRGFEDAPLIEEAFGFDPDAKGGDVLEIATLPAFEKSDVNLWGVQLRIERALSGELKPRLKKGIRRPRR